MVKTRMEIMQEMHEATQESIIGGEIEMENSLRTLPIFVEELEKVKAQEATMNGSPKYQYHKNVVEIYESQHKKIAISMANKEAALKATKISFEILTEMIVEEGAKTK